MRCSSNLLIAAALLVLVPVMARAQAVPTNLMANSTHNAARTAVRECNANVANTFTGPICQTLTLGTNTYTVTIGPYEPNACDAPPPSWAWYSNARENIRAVLQCFTPVPAVPAPPARPSTGP
jgi:hypothetical protein